MKVWRSLVKSNVCKKENERDSYRENESKDDGKMQKNVPSRIKYGIELISGVGLLIGFSWYISSSLKEDKDSCSLLLKHGKWIDADHWRPDGCTMHNYSNKEIQSCLANNKVAFIGDSRTQDLYHATKKILNDVNMTNTETMEFFWCNGSSEEIKKVFSDWLKHAKALPSLVIIAFGMLDAYNSTGKGTKVYRDRLLSIKESLLEISKSQLKDRKESIIPQIIWKLQEPIVESKLKKSQRNITNIYINEINDDAKNIFGSTGIKLLEASFGIAKEKPEETKDGVHYSEKIQNVELDIILNSFCNQITMPLDATCCKRTTGLKKYQYSIFAAFASLTLLCIVLLFWGRET